jgi:hypothetical protein
MMVREQLRPMTMGEQMRPMTVGEQTLSSVWSGR